MCLLDDKGEETRVELLEVPGFCRHGYLPALVPGQHYGFRVHGPRALQEGRRFNPRKLVLDPYAKAIEGRGASCGNDGIYPTGFE